MDALVHVVRAFRDDSIVHAEGTIDPLRDIETVGLELLFADLAVVENRIDRIENSKKVTKEMTEASKPIKKQVLPMKAPCAKPVIIAGDIGTWTS